MSPPYRKRREFRICPICRVEFLALNEQHRACSKSCATLAAKRRIGGRSDAPSQDTKRLITEKVR